MIVQILPIFSATRFGLMVSGKSHTYYIFTGKRGIATIGIV